MLFRSKIRDLVIVLILSAAFFPFNVPCPVYSAEPVKTLIVAQAGDVASIDNQQSVGPAKNALIHVYDWQWIRFRVTATPDNNFTIRRRDDGDLMPGIVWAWEAVKVNPDGTAVKRFHIRPGAKFHSGNPVTAHDLKYSVMRRAAFRRDGTNRMFGWYSYDGKSLKDVPNQITIDEAIKVIDDYTLEVNVWHDNPLFFGHMAQRTYFDSKLVKANATKDDPWAKKFVAKNDCGSGPYRIETWEVGNQMVLKRFEEYWGPRPPIDRIIFKTVPDLTSRVLLLKRGDIDVALDLPRRELEALRKDPNIKIIDVPSTNHNLICMNPKDPPFDNKNFRLALIHAFPYDEVVASVYGGSASPQYGTIPTGMAGALTERRYKMDLDLARKYLEKSDLEKGLTVTMKWQTGQDDHKKIGILFGENLKKIGVELKLQQLPRGQFQTGMRNRTLGFFMRTMNVWIKTPAVQHWVQYSPSAHTCPVDYQLPKTGELLAKVMREPDPKKRAEMNAAIQEEILDGAYFIFTCHPNFQLAMRKNIVGYVAQNTELHFFWLVDKL